MADSVPVRFKKRERVEKMPLNILRDGETTIKIKFSVFEGGGGGVGAERKTVQNVAFHSKRHDNKILKSQILLSKHFVVIAQAPTFVYSGMREPLACRSAC